MQLAVLRKGFCGRWWACGVVCGLGRGMAGGVDVSALRVGSVGAELRWASMYLWARVALGRGASVAIPRTGHCRVGCRDALQPLNSCFAVSCALFDAMVCIVWSCGDGEHTEETATCGGASSRRKKMGLAETVLLAESSCGAHDPSPQSVTSTSMALDRSAGRLARCIRCTRHERLMPIRTFTTTAPSRLETQETQASSEPPPPPPVATDAAKPKVRDANTVSTPAAEQQLIQRQRITPIGSRRRRAAIASTSNIPFSELPYQCFQEARAILQADRQEKLEQIRVQRARIQRLKLKSVAPQDEAHNEKRMADMRRLLEEQKILADINDPVVKRRFEDGEGRLRASAVEGDEMVVTNVYFRRPGQADLQIPGGPTMAVLPPHAPRPADHADERSTGCATCHRPCRLHRSLLLR